MQLSRDEHNSELSKCAIFYLKKKKFSCYCLQCHYFDILFLPPAQEILDLQSEVDRLRQLMQNAKTGTDSRIKGEWSYSFYFVVYCDIMKWLQGVLLQIFLEMFQLLIQQNQKGKNVCFFILELRIFLDEKNKRLRNLQVQLEETDFAQAQMSEYERQLYITTNIMWDCYIFTLEKKSALTGIYLLIFSEITKCDTKTTKSKMKIHVYSLNF